MATQEAKKLGRRPKDPKVVLDALEALLTDVPLHELNVENILDAANISRATFYLHFATKYAAASALFERVVGEIAGAMSAFVDRPDSTPVLEALRTGIDDSTAAWFQHRTILETAVQNAHVVPEFDRNLRDMKAAFADMIAVEINRERAAGLAPAGRDAVPLSAALVECTLHLLYTSGLSDTDSIPGPDGIGDVIYDIWCGTVYRVAG